ncbi:hypothetical protein GGR07_001431 [Bacteroides pyogenes]|nr:hypothetical protein [Bacteroides pyogenes]SUV32073.1 Uncharacterised protein [Bacteroides pyogenes]
MLPVYEYIINSFVFPFVIAICFIIMKLYRNEKWLFTSC